MIALLENLDFYLGAYRWSGGYLTQEELEHNWIWKVNGGGNAVNGTM